VIFFAFSTYFLDRRASEGVKKRTFVALYFGLKVEKTAVFGTLEISELTGSFSGGVNL
jgi:hypothetical protein